MKCTHCGNKELIKASIPMKWEGHDLDISNIRAEVYLCLKCGHCEFFAMDKIAHYKETVSRIAELEQELKPLQKELSRLRSKGHYDSLNNRVHELEEALNSIDITIRQQQELEDKLCKARADLNGLDTQIGRLKSKIDPIISELDKLKRALSEGTF